MTKEQKIEAFAMRLDGKTYQEIGEKFGVTKQCIEQTLKKICPERKNRKTNAEECIYKGLAEYIKKENCTLRDLTELTDLNVANIVTMSERIRGKRQFRLEEIRNILKNTGMTFEECFKEK